MLDGYWACVFSRSGQDTVSSYCHPCAQSIPMFISTSVIGQNAEGRSARQSRKCADFVAEVGDERTSAVRTSLMVSKLPPVSARPDGSGGLEALALRQSPQYCREFTMVHDTEWPAVVVVQQAWRSVSGSGRWLRAQTRPVRHVGRGDGDGRAEGCVSSARIASRCVCGRAATVRRRQCRRAIGRRRVRAREYRAGSFVLAPLDSTGTLDGKLGNHICSPGSVVSHHRSI